MLSQLAGCWLASSHSSVGFLSGRGEEPASPKVEGCFNKTIPRIRIQCIHQAVEWIEQVPRFWSHKNHLNIIKTGGLERRNDWNGPSNGLVSCWVLVGYLRKVSEFHGVHETMKLVTRGNSCFQNDQKGRPSKEFGSNELGFFMHSFNKFWADPAWLQKARLMIFSRF